MRKHEDFMNEPDYGYIDIESCFDPVFEPPAELLEEWSKQYEGPEPTIGKHIVLCRGAGWHGIFLLRESLHQNL